MSKMIELDSAIEVIHKYFLDRITENKTYIDENGEECYYESDLSPILGYNADICKALRELPTTEIVRCEDCRYCDKFETYWCSLKNIDIDGNDFCKRGSGN